MVAGNSGKASPAFVDNFGMGQIGFSLGTVENHKAARPQIEPGSQAASDKQVGIGIQPKVED